MKPPTPKTELQPSTQLRKAVFGGSLMIDRGNGQAQSAKGNPPQKQFSLNRAASKSKFLSVSTVIATEAASGARAACPRFPIQQYGQAARATFALLACFVFCIFARAAEVMPPKPARYFNDYANVVPASIAQKLDKTLEDFERTTSSQVLVAVFPKMQSDSSIEDYTVRVAQSWRVGQKAKNNCAVLFLFTQDRKVFLQVGYGLEGALPVALCKRIIDEKITPRFKASDFDGGLTAGVGAIMTAVSGRTAADSGIHLEYLITSTVPAPPADSPKIDSSKVKFLPQKPCSVGFGNTVDQSVMGVVSREVDLSDDPTALQMLQMGFTFGQEECPPRGENFQGVLRGRTVSVSLKPGDPVTFTATNLPEIFQVHGFGTTFDTPSDLVSGTWADSKPSLILGYMNAPRALKQSQAYDAEKVRQRDAVLELQKQAEQKKQSEIAARSAAFVKANGVAHFVTVQQLAANPFVYQGQVVAIYGEFQQMNSATEGLFLSKDKSFVVSGIPAARFTLETSMVMLAGRVLGNIEIKLPLLGATLVPHLTFVGSAFCQERGGSDYDIRLK